jgi:hypothetical protein
VGLNPVYNSSSARDKRSFLFHIGSNSISEILDDSSQTSREKTQRKEDQLATNTRASNIETFVKPKSDQVKAICTKSEELEAY